MRRKTTLAALGAAAGVAWLFTLGPLRDVDAEGGEVDAPTIDGLDRWLERREEILAAFAEHVYGPPPADIAPVVVSREAIPPERAGGVAGVEQWRIELGAAGAFHLVLVLPPGRGPAPIIVMQNFCGNRAAFPGRPEAIAEPLQYYPWICKEAAFDPALRFTFGEHIAIPPYDLIAARGYALALVYGGDVVPDATSHARRALATFAPDAGALSAWAWVHSRTLDVLLEDPRIDPTRTIVWGQSRQGKAALLAAARDERFAAVVALQSGRGGDALTAHRSGKSVWAVMQQFPYWFTRRFADYMRADPPVDQHELLALIAPRALLIGHARRDAWADPVGARMAVEGAKPAFERLHAPAPEFFMRRGHHGIERVDWERTLDFLDRRLRPVSADRVARRSAGNGAQTRP